MCRLLAVLAPEPIPMRHALVDAIDSLQNQSGRNMDGWGMAWYEGSAADPQVRLVKDFMPAAMSSVYETTAARVTTDHLIAHVRAATCGTKGVANTHPFRLGRWIFAHNGTVRGIDAFRAALEETLPPELRDRIRGNTDSELVFLLIAARAGFHRGAGVAHQTVEAAIESTIHDLAARSRAEVGPDAKQATMNTLLTDGATLYATRWGKGLWYRRLGGGPGRSRRTAGLLPAVLARDEPARLEIASQPLTFDASWVPFDDRTLVTVAPGLRLRERSIGVVA